jgi:hypothetical protein
MRSLWNRRSGGQQMPFRIRPLDLLVSGSSMSELDVVIWNRRSEDQEMPVLEENYNS